MSYCMIPLTKGIRRALLANKRAAVWASTLLFTSGEQGAWYDPSDFSTMFQDSAGTIPVTATTQPVGKILDKSGRGNHLTQVTTASRPTLQQDAGGFYYLNFDGVDDSMKSAAAFDMSASDKVSVFVGVTKSASKSGSFVCELSPNSVSNAGSFGLDMNGAAANGDWPGGFLFGSEGPGAAIKDGSGVSITAGTSAVIGMLADGAAGTTPATQISLRKNGIDLGTGSTSGSDTNGNMGASYTLFVGGRNSAGLTLQGRIYQLVIRGAVTSGANLTNVERFVGGKMGIAL